MKFRSVERTNTTQQAIALMLLLCAAVLLCIAVLSYFADYLPKRRDELATHRTSCTTVRDDVNGTIVLKTREICPPNTTHTCWARRTYDDESISFTPLQDTKEIWNHIVAFVIFAYVCVFIALSIYVNTKFRYKQ